MTANELRQKYLQFFIDKGHKLIPSSPLVPEHDPTALFINSGMHPLVPYLLGQPHPLGKRLTSVQKCVRTDDINEVGDSTHLTFFEMLGNWSLGDYFKKEAINWSFEFLTDEKQLNLDPERIYVSVFGGENKIPLDEESICLWQEVFNRSGIKAKIGDYKRGVENETRIFPYPREKNWWGPAGQTGPCGPDTEMFYDTGKDHDKNFGEICHPNCPCGKYVEIWNDVFMQYNKKLKTQNSKLKTDKYKDDDYVFEKLLQKNVDTGLGLERELMVLQGKESVFDTDVFANIILRVEEIVGKNQSQPSVKRPIRIISDHLRAAAFIIADGVMPSNKEQGSILRRLIRRSIRFARQIGVLELFTFRVAEAVIDDYGKIYPELKKNEKEIQEILNSEEEKFSKTIDKGLSEWEKMIKNNPGEISGEQAFFLYETFGFPIEIIEELAREKNISIDLNGFQDEFEKHQEKSRQGASRKFSGGLADHSEATTKLHTATHLLQKALRDILGSQVHQAGSNITAERLRFDFTYDSKLTEDQLRQAEDMVNNAIADNLKIGYEIMPIQKALKEGALAFFGEKYPEKVKVYTIGNSKQVFSREVCGGPHVAFTAELGRFKIKKEEAAGFGKRRIYAVLEK